MRVLQNDSFSADSTPQTKFVGVYSGRLHANDKSDPQLGTAWPPDDINNPSMLEVRSLAAKKTCDFNLLALPHRLRFDGWG
jgi:hypothetical protein